MLPVIDTHCHLDFEDYAGELPEVLDRARRAGVNAFVCIGAGNDTRSARAAVALAAAEADVWAVVGVHPHDAASMTEADWAELEGLGKAARVVGIGETGLDYHYDQSPRAVQRDAYRRFLELARRLQRPVISHIRDAHEDAKQILTEAGRGHPGVIHCFTGERDDARAYLDLGQMISFSGILTFKNAEPIREAARFTPLDRIVIETDAPYLAPIPYRGKRNEPAYVVETLKCLANLKQLDLETTARATTENARRLFGLPAN
ncbi:MAG: TatD family hydrolase [Myxococcales bacterium]|nr:TatD family hydrolase [Myxococcales bacterium]